MGKLSYTTNQVNDVIGKGVNGEYTNPINNHIASATAHLASNITNNSAVSGAKVSNALETLGTNTTNHINSTTAHNAQNIRFTTTDPSLLPYTNVKVALEGLSDELTQIISQSGTSDTEVVNA